MSHIFFQTRTLIRFLLLITSILASYLASYAQKPVPVCGTDYLGLVRTLRQASTTPDKAQTSSAPASATYTIPVVFVVYHTGEEVGVGSNVSQANIQGALDEMNRKFAGTNSGGSGIDTKIRFVLAKRMPNCTEFNGIYRINASSFPDYSSQGVTSFDNAFALAKAFPPFQRSQPNDFLTIRVVRAMPFAAGFAQMGGGDIFVVSDGVDGSPGNGLLAHEMGHVLSLYHTFEGSSLVSGQYTCPPNANPLTQGDRVADTDPHKNNDFTCTPTDPNTCTGTNYGATLADNLMNYTCFRKFTQGQITKMRDFLADQLPGLTTSVFTQPPTSADVLVTASCSISLGYPPTNYVTGISRVKFNTIDRFSETFPTGNNTGNYSDFSCGAKTTVLPNTSYPFSLTTNSNQQKIYIDFNNDGNFNETNELVFSTSSSVSSGNILIPATAVTNVYLRMRVVVDPGSTAPTACNLPGAPTVGCGEIEDYGILISAPCTQMYTLKSGQWNDPTVWSCNRVPTQTDVTRVSTGHTISVSTSTATARRVIYQTGGRVTFSAAGRLSIVNTL
ncbi:hypothetical protein IC229_06435 [Spirosoma sp. BT702]|uniref:Peptidase M43 pregnancy-associated plasma-A domain-containing protein n=1 Tax=Spirosoma profusum TaxID=2771354 RepID=A0A926XY87_9BACT|nr:GEVED domain-containing protein [Spirosoma profusum]MBD2700262.1 hypothetical protein [Spirosoma profusum]